MCNVRTVLFYWPHNEFLTGSPLTRRSLAGYAAVEWSFRTLLNVIHFVDLVIFVVASLTSVCEHQ